ncbi:bifunctional serine/threonine-protein kinase/glutamate ABC transporter substrate-binding protein [Streptomyces sp. NPDC005953]|uniref:bifunctional serine/threonine-protein kinase/glutamate ABC transporter substrate-binding protein n=1 Tax=Streptomyces sp. NPDC005953 TaxID=3156719 RepID=UPI0033CEC8BB
MIDGRFELLARLGGGGMGLVWRARDLVLHRDVALKEVRPPDAGLAEHDPTGARALRARVLREARALARTDHPNVVTIYHIVDGGEDTYPWLVMELVPGGSFQEHLGRRGTLTPEEAARVGRGVLAGLRAAHAVGIQHRDIKPANVLLRPDGRPVLTDFGIAAVQGSTALTATGSFIGTPDYMAPERVSGQDGGPAADLWSLALMLYVAVEGHHPLRRANTLATLAAVLSEDVPPPRRAGALTEALMAVLVRDPAGRPDAQTLDRLLEAAESASEGGSAPTSYPLAPPAAPPSDAPPDPLPASPAASSAGTPPVPSVAPSRTRPQSWNRRRTRAYAAAALVAVPLGGVLLWLQLQGDGEGSKTAKDGSTASSGAPTQGSGEPVNDSKGIGGITIGVKSDQPGLGLKTVKDEFKGFDVAVATYIAGELGHRPDDITWKPVRSDERESLLASGEVDLVVAMYVMGDQREEKVDFVGPYLVGHQDVLMRVDETSISSATSLNGKKICSTRGSTPGKYLQNQVAPQVQIVENDSYERCLTALINNEVDGVTTDDAILAGYAAQNPGKYRLGGFRLSNEEYGIGLREKSHLKTAVQAALDKMTREGEWKKAVQEHLPLLQRETPQS